MSLSWKMTSKLSNTFLHVSSAYKTMYFLKIVAALARTYCYNGSISSLQLSIVIILPISVIIWLLWLRFGDRYRKIKYNMG